MLTFLWGRLELQLLQLGAGNLWKRNVDDIILFIVWTSSETELLDYLTRINQIHSTIKFTHEIGHSEITFLAVTIYKT